MDSSKDRWAEFHKKALPYKQAIVQEPFKTLIETVADFVKGHKIDAIYETGFGTGYVLIRLALKLLEVIANGTDNSKILVDRATSLSEELGAPTFLDAGDIFKKENYVESNQIIYHQGLLEHFPDDKIQKLLKLQTKNSVAVIFSLPSKFYGKQDFGDEHLLTLEEWKKILKSFEIYQLRYYDNNKHILGILKGGLYDRTESTGNPVRSAPESKDRG